MKKIDFYLKPKFFYRALIASFLIVPLKSIGSNRASFENVRIESAIQTNTPPQKSKPKKKVKVKQKMTDTKMVAVPAGTWGGQDMIVNVEPGGVTIQYPCADGRIEQVPRMDAQGNFTANGVHIPQRGGPIRVDAKSGQRARYEGKISGNTMMLKVTLTESKEVLGDFTLEYGKTPRMTRCY